jgi:hypothetical protein
MQIDESAEHFSNANAPITNNLEWDSTVTIERASHLEKQKEGSLSTHDGMQISESDLQSPNAEWPISDNLEGDSKLTVARARQ